MENNLKFCTSERKALLVWKALTPNIQASSISKQKLDGKSEISNDNNNVTPSTDLGTVLSSKSSREFIEKEEKESLLVEEKNPTLEPSVNRSFLGPGIPKSLKAGFSLNLFRKNMTGKTSCEQVCLDVLRSPLLPSLSPGGLLVETWLKQRAVPYQVVVKRSESNLPEGWAQDPHSTIDLVHKKFKVPLDGQRDLSKEHRDIEYSLIRLLEGNTAGYIATWRYAQPDNEILGHNLDLSKVLGINAPTSMLKWYFKHIVCRSELKNSRCEGSDVENLLMMAKKDLEVLSSVLASSDYFFKSTSPGLLDLHVFAQLSMILYISPIVLCPLKEFLESSVSNLSALVGRVRNIVWGDDWEKVVTAQEASPPLRKSMSFFDVRKSRFQKDVCENDESSFLSTTFNSFKGHLLREDLSGHSIFTQDESSIKSDIEDGMEKLDETGETDFFLK